MAKTTNPEDILSSALPDPEDLTRLQQETADQLNQAMRGWSERIAEMNAEMIGFMQQRGKTNQAMLEKLIECRNINELGQLQNEWLRAAMGDYANEMQRMMEMYTRTLMSPFEAFGHAGGKAAAPKAPDATNEQAGKSAKKQSSA